ncbi:MAG: molybdenum cofactor guanylyltransferase [Anaerolineae bacterium]
MIDLSVAVMAGGQSRRMGTDKAFVTLDGKPLVAHLLARLAPVARRETLLITNRPADYAHLGLPMFADVLPGKGSLGGIYTALHYSRSPYTLVLAVDMPFVQPALLQYMIDLCGEGEAQGQAYDVIAPRVAGYPQGLHAIYRKTCLPIIRQRLEADRLRVIGFYDEVHVRTLDEPEYQALDPQGLSFFNVNTPEQLAEAQAMLARQRDADSAARE